MPTKDGQREAWIYAARTRTAEEALASIKEQLPDGWVITVTPGFLQAPTVIEEHQIAEDEIVRISTVTAN